MTVSRRFQKRLEDETSLSTKNRDCDVTSATLCAYAFVTTEEDRALVVALTDDASSGRDDEGRQFRKSTPAFGRDAAFAATANANLADWLVRRTRAFTAARAAAAGDAYASPASAASAETTARDGEYTPQKRDESRNARNARRETRARVFRRIDLAVRGGGNVRVFVRRRRRRRHRGGTRESGIG